MNEFLRKDRLDVLASMHGFKEINLEYPISEVLEINGDIYLHFDKNTLYGTEEYAPTNYIQAGSYALYERGKGLVSSPKFDALAISSDEMEYYIKASSDVKVMGSKIEYFVKILEQKTKWITNERKFKNYKDTIENAIKEFNESKPYMQHALAEKIGSDTKDDYIKEAIITARKEVASITKQDIEKNFNRVKSEKEKVQAEEINYEFKKLENSFNKISTVAEYRDCYKPEDILKEIINAKRISSDFKCESNYKFKSHLKNSEKLQEQQAKLENAIDKAVESFNKKVDEYNEKNEEKLPHLSSKENASKYDSENFAKDDFDDFEDFSDDGEV